MFRYHKRTFVMHVNGPGLDNYNGKAEELETKLNERVVVGRAVGC